jgi:hypothetical protein
VRAGAAADRPHADRTAGGYRPRQEPPLPTTPGGPLGYLFGRTSACPVLARLCAPQRVLGQNWCAPCTTPVTVTARVGGDHCRACATPPPEGIGTRRMWVPPPNDRPSQTNRGRLSVSVRTTPLPTTTSTLVWGLCATGDARARAPEGAVRAQDGAGT